MRIKAYFTRRDDRVLVDLGVVIQHLDMDYQTCYAWANALIKLGQEAERVATGHARMTKREVNAFEEAIVSPNHKVIGSS